MYEERHITTSDFLNRHHRFIHFYEITRPILFVSYVLIVLNDVIATNFSVLYFTFSAFF